MSEFTSTIYALIIEDGGVMTDRQKARASLDQQLQLQEAQWQRKLIAIAGSLATVDTWGTSKSAEMSQKALMRRIGGPAKPLKPKLRKVE